ncbi:hypothetical protein ES319_A03G086500v1 [Gossypium barbadense]|uniref:MADS-box domain-containing protein n=2 Tax=Gossypium TaxID=3633 RepID=A0A5J5WF28_GOSBA|nr:hypothetical protein ES319_A03G086500v1 [Gossypium barbadense]TYH24481.1 hypothetical protein ES288_A03G095300v1 [Gossypium darwinii]
MIRKKVKLAYITNDSSRKATYKKRNKGLMKKMSELNILCGIDNVAIMYSPYESQTKLKKHCKDNRETKMTQVMFNNIYSKWVVHGLNFGDINDLNLLLDEKMSNIVKRMDAFAMKPLYTQGALSSSSSSMVALPPMTMVMPKAILRTGTKGIVQLDVNNMDPMKRQQWIMELMNNNNNNPQTHVGGDEMMFQFGDNINPNNGH